MWTAQNLAGELFLCQQAPWELHLAEAKPQRWRGRTGAGTRLQAALEHLDEAKREPKQVRDLAEAGRDWHGQLERRWLTCATWRSWWSTPRSGCQKSRAPPTRP